MNFEPEPIIERVSINDQATEQKKHWARVYFGRFSSLILRGLFFNGILIETAISAIILYLLFYWIYMPTVELNQPIFFNFSDDGASAKLDLYNVQKSMKLSSYQAYNMEVYLKVPTSEQNQNIGNFMVSLQLINSNNEPYLTIKKPAICKYRSALVRQIHGLVFFFPMLITGIGDESEVMFIRMIDGISDLEHKDVRSIVVNVDKRLQIYNSELRITAAFSGIRYLMYYWKIPSASLFIGVSFLLQITFGLLSWALLEKYIQNNSIRASTLNNQFDLADYGFNQEQELQDASTPTTRFIRPQNKNNDITIDEIGSPVLERSFSLNDYESIVPDMDVNKYADEVEEEKKYYDSPITEQEIGLESLAIFDIQKENQYEDLSDFESVPTSQSKIARTARRRKYIIKS
ncbi:hypothetical protein BB561_000098 [Smittium simulii]|uniref:Seipin n=1 Tax=Smittium simulii TaxID=133385 RepID=A0A2T9Z0J5_9FUNG|nr:hypothetical protein BB561_000098 [Smittium simulii]